MMRSVRNDKLIEAFSLIESFDEAAQEYALEFYVGMPEDAAKAAAKHEGAKRALIAFMRSVLSNDVG